MAEFRAILIAGPTTSGKSALAMSLAARLEGVIINADAMQVYRELRILTARPSAADEALVPHHLYGTQTAAEAYSVGRWLEDVAPILDDLRRAGRPAIIVGGTGLYFKALTEGLSPIPAIPDDIRDRWRLLALAQGAPALHAMLLERDPETARLIRRGDRQRVVRALEVLEATGRSLTCWQRRKSTPLIAGHEADRLFLSVDRETLYRRCNSRFDAMIAAVVLDEVRSLMALGLPPGLPAMRAHGVPSLIAHLRGLLPLEAAAEQAKRDTRHYAKRQFTWAKRNMISWEWIFPQQMKIFLRQRYGFVPDAP